MTLDARREENFISGLGVRWGTDMGAVMGAGVATSRRGSAMSANANSGMRSEADMSPRGDRAILVRLRPTAIQLLRSQAAGRNAGSASRLGAGDLMPAAPIENMAAELLANHNLLSALAGPTIALTVDVERSRAAGQV